VKVTLGVLLSHGFPVPAPFVIGYSHLLQSIMTGAGNAVAARGRELDACRVLFVQDFPIDHARNKLCRMFLDEDNGDYLLFLDADMKHPPDLAHRLVAHNKDVVTARYVMRKPPFFSVAMRKVGDGDQEYQAIEKLEHPVHGLVKVDAAGAGALLISRKALTDIRARFGDDWFRYQDGPDGLRSRSEDMWFFERARDCGYQPWLDADLHCKHVAQFEVDHSYHEPYREALDNQLKKATV
jgi:hypothetical protein